MEKHKKSILILVFAVILSFISASRLSACDVTTVDLWIGNERADVINGNIDTVYQPEWDNLTWFRIEWDANEPDDNEFEVKIYDNHDGDTTRIDTFSSSDFPPTTRSISPSERPILNTVGIHYITVTVQRVGIPIIHESAVRTLVVYDLQITSVNPKTFTTDNSDNDINCIAEIQPGSLSSYNNNIEWYIEDNPNDSNNCGNPTKPSNGNNVTWSATIPPIPSDSNGRGFPLSYKITAQLTIEGEAVTTSDTYITQDETDQCRQEYIDMNKT